MIEPKPRRRAWWLAVPAAVLALIGGLIFALAQPAPATNPANDVELQSAKVIGGTATTSQQHPWAVYLTTRSGGQYCGGTLIAPTKVLTAAHCIANRSVNDIKVVAGRTDTQSRAGSVLTVRGTWIHPEFRDVFSGDDIGVITLTEPASYPTMALAEAGDRRYVPGTKATLVGWGATQENGATSRQLMSATIPVLPDSACAKPYPSYDTAEMFCAGYEQGGIDACQGDSGGPLVADSRLIGVTSWGEGCGQRGKPGVYTKVSQYLALIKEQLNKPGSGSGQGLNLLGLK